MKCIMLVVSRTYDETPIKIRLSNSSRPSKRRREQLASGEQQKEENGAVTAKVLQTRLKVGWLLQVTDAASKHCNRMVFFHGVLPTRLQALEHTKAEDICSAQLKILAELSNKGCEVSPDCLQVHVASADRYSANGAAERGIQARRLLETPLRLPCLVRMVSSCSTWMLHICEEHVSAMISLGLVLSSGGMMNKFRGHVCEEICSKLVLVNRDPPAGDVAAYRHQVYDQFLSLNLCREETKTCFKRRRAVQRAVLNKYVCGNLQDPNHFFLYTRGQQMDMAQARQLVKLSIVPALLPRHIGIFPRHRWFGGETVVDALALLESHHRILVPALLRLTQDVSKVSSSVGERLEMALDGWDGAAQSVADLHSQRAALEENEGLGVLQPEGHAEAAVPEPGVLQDI